MRSCLRLVFVTFFFSLGACGLRAEHDEIGRTQEEIEHGTVTDMRPEVGLLLTNTGRCTGTLVESNVVITAAHCVNFGTNAVSSGGFGFFQIMKGGVVQKSYAYNRYRSFGTAPADYDVALLRLVNEVPSSVAKPVKIAKQPAPIGSVQTQFGFGAYECPEGQPAKHDGKKRYRTFLSGQNGSMGCPGDSGGPIFALGEIVALHSGVFTKSDPAGAFQAGEDVYAFPSMVFDELTALLDQW